MNELFTIFILTFIIHVISTLSYSVRLVGIRTGRIAISFALFNIFVLISRTSNSFLAPLLAKKIEQDILLTQYVSVESDFRLLIISASIATLVASFFIPTFQRLFSRLVMSFNVKRSIPKVLIHGFSKAGVKQIKQDLNIPSSKNIIQLVKIKDLPWKIAILNILTVSFFTIGVFSSLYAGYINPEFRMTASTLSSIVNGIATILLFIFIDPFLSALTDDVVTGSESESYFRSCVVLMVASRFVGTLFGQILFLPAAKLIVIVSKII